MAGVDHQKAVSLQHHIEDMRSLINCKICLRPFYEPYILACGHTYCYGCLRSWFVGNDAQGRRKRKNCPDCRTEVVAQPAPNYILRDLTHMFVDRAELLPEDETITEHVIGKDEEAIQLAIDKAGPGLFQGLFKRNRAHFEPIRDIQDGVARCPQCMWELEDGMCNHCGYIVPGYDSDDDDFTDDDDEGEDISIHTSDYSDGQDVEVPSHGQERPRFYGLDLDDDDEDQSSREHIDFSRFAPMPDFHQDDLHDFVDEYEDLDEDDYPDEIDDEDGISDDTSESGQTYSAAHTISDGSDNEDNLEQTVNHRHSRLSRPSHQSTTVDSDPPTNYDDSDDEPIVRRGRPQTRRGRQTVVITDDDDDEEENDGDRGTASVDNTARFSPEEAAADSEADSTRPTNGQRNGTTFNTSGDDASDTSSASNNDDNNNNDDNSDEHSGESSSEESDDTVTPPQPAQRRQQHLQSQRARRGVKTFSRGPGISMPAQQFARRTGGPPLQRRQRRGSSAAAY